jgi:hypothetical protein
VPQLRWLVAGFTPRQPEFDPRSSHVGFVVDKVALWQVFSSYLGFPWQFSFHRLFDAYHLSCGAGKIGRIVADVPSRLCFIPPQETKNGGGGRLISHRRCAAASWQNCEFKYNLLCWQYLQQQPLQPFGRRDIYVNEPCCEKTCDRCVWVFKKRYYLILLFLVDGGQSVLLKWGTCPSINFHEVFCPLGNAV